VESEKGKPEVRFAARVVWGAGGEGKEDKEVTGILTRVWKGEGKKRLPRHAFLPAFNGK